MSLEHNPTVLSLFCGAGGLDLGFLQASFDVRVSIDIEEDFCKTITLNTGTFFSANHKTLVKDISQLELEEIPVKTFDVIIGGPPCQSFSAAGRRAGGVYGVNDFRGSLFWHYCRLLDSYKPKGFLFENVRGLLQANKGYDWSIIRSEFENLGYHISFRVLDAADYGVPQHRERLIVVGLQNQEFLFTRPSHGEDSIDKKRHVGVGEALADIDDPTEIVPHYSGKYGSLLMEVPPGMNYLYFTEEMGHPKPRFAWRSRFSDFLYKVDPAIPCKTIVASQGKYSGPFHWRGRKFTEKEFKRLQSFPDEYEFFGPYNLVVKQLGNSVAPKFATSLAKALFNQMAYVRFDEIEYLPSSFKLSFDKRKAKKARKTRAKTLQVKKSNRQLSFFENNEQEEQDEQYRNVYEEWVYLSPRQQLGDKNNSSISKINYGKFIFSAKKKNKSWQIFIQKELEDNKKSAIEFELILLFKQEFGEQVSAINCKMVSNTLWDVCVAWDAINKCIQLSSSYEDIKPLYGHFTEPYPKFSLECIIHHSDDAGLGRFLKSICEFSFLDQLHTYDELEDFWQQSSPLEIIQRLRDIGFDVRVHQTNRTIPEGKFKICYPFVLGLQSQSFVTWNEIGFHKTADSTSIPLKENME